MDTYTLYLDESEIPIKNSKQEDENIYFAIGGVILPDDYHDNHFSQALSEIKRKIWCEDKYQSVYDTFVLHEMDITAAHHKHFSALKNKYNRVFAKYSKYNLLYEELSNLVNNSDITVLCAFVNQNELNRIYPMNSINDRLSILMQIIIENYYHFLVTHNAKGKICYEYIDSGQNKIVQKRYDNIRQTGTMFYSAKSINKSVIGFCFKKKSENIAGLQLADFVPNTLTRFKCNKTNNSDVTFKSIYAKLYDGNGLNMCHKFGLKEIP